MSKKPKSRSGIRSSSSPQTILGEIQAKLDAIHPREFVTPGRLPHEEDRVVGHVDDYIKRLFSLREKLFQELKPLMREGGSISVDLESKAATPDNISGLIEYMANNPEGRERLNEKARRFTDLCRAVAHLNGLFQIVDIVCQREVKKLGPASFPVQEKYVEFCIDSNWNLVWGTEAGKKNHLLEDKLYLYIVTKGRHAV